MSLFAESHANRLKIEMLKEDMTSMSALVDGEQLIAEVKLQTTLFSKASYRLTSKRLVATKTRSFLGLFPIGSSESTYPLNNIASISIGTRFRFGTFIVGLILLLLGLGSIAHGVGIVLLIIGILAMIGAFQGAFLIGNNAGQAMSHLIYFTARKQASEFVQQVNNAIASRS